ncbi:MAG: glycerate kinase [Mycoplasma sp.]|nr:glycerate kinase [Mycoplasma sp.]
MKTKKILVSSDSFKGTFTSIEIGEKIKEKIPNVDILSISDGGEGFTESVLLNTNKYKEVRIKTFDALKNEITIIVAMNEDTAIFDAASIVALDHYPNKSAIYKTTYGIGIVLKEIEENYKNIKKVVFGLGGVSTSDGGFGAAIGLGCQFFDENKNEITSFDDVNKIKDIKKVDLPFEVIGCTDVDNPLLGENGAISIYGNQKFMKDDEKSKWEKNMEIYSSIFNNDNNLKPGAGAAGGLGFFILEHLKGILSPGIDMILETSNFKNKSQNYDLVITGEGRFDNQSFMGKVPINVANSTNTDVILIAGDIDADENELKKHFVKWFKLRKNNEDINTTIKESASRLNEVILNIKEYIEK